MICGAGGTYDLSSQTVIVSGASNTINSTGNPTNVSILGANNKLTIQDTCGELVLSGVSNASSITSNCDNVQLSGGNNTSFIGGNCEHMNLTGGHNQITVNGNCDELQLDGSNNIVMINENCGAVFLSGSANKFTIVENCHSLTINGHQNVIHIGGNLSNLLKIEANSDANNRTSSITCGPTTTIFGSALNEYFSNINEQLNGSGFTININGPATATIGDNNSNHNIDLSGTLNTIRAGGLGGGNAIMINGVQVQGAGGMIIVNGEVIQGNPVNSAGSNGTSNTVHVEGNIGFLEIKQKKKEDPGLNQITSGGSCENAVIIFGSQNKINLVNLNKISMDGDRNVVCCKTLTELSSSATQTDVVGEADYTEIPDDTRNVIILKA